MATRRQQAATKLEFLTADEDKKLTIVLFNHLSIGQVELARAVLRQLHTITPDHTIRVLKALITQGRPSNWYNFT
jgi:hypothetical protein